MKAKAKQRKAYKEFCKKMSDLGYTAKLSGFMRAMALGEDYDKQEYMDLMLRVKLEELGIDSTKYPADGS